jgi:EAL domain-containing protein (putative c-di-GMP-specific phosphodiesterase class I)
VLQQIGAGELEHRGLANRLHQALSVRVRDNLGSGPVPLLTLTVSACDPLQHADAASALRDLGLHLSPQAHEVRKVHFLRTSFAQAARREAWLLEQLGGWTDAGNPPLAYMPKCDLRSRRVVGAEALLRFHDGQGALVSPGQIVALATRHRMLAAFEWSTLEQAGRDARQWADTGSPQALSVNISSASLVTPGFAARLLELLGHHRLPPTALTLELTEYDAVPDIDTVRDNVRLLTARGLRLSLDDFGSGHSGLAVLARIPFSEIKVDHTMVAMIGSPRMRSAIELALESARRYDATLVAEGVETEEQLGTLRALGVSQGQGHLFARAISLKELMAFSHGRAMAACGEAPT